MPASVELKSNRAWPLPPVVALAGLMYCRSPRPVSVTLTFASVEPAASRTVTTTAVARPSPRVASWTCTVEVVALG